MIVAGQKLRGTALPTALAILVMLGLLAMNAVRTAALETKLTGSIAAAQTAFELAGYGIGLGLREARQDPTRLPATDSSSVYEFSHASLPDLGDYAAAIRFRARDAYCPSLNPQPAERLHYEIRSIGTAGTAVSTQLQGFFICREICSSTTCTGAELPAIASYWTVLNNDATSLAQ